MAEEDAWRGADRGALWRWAPSPRRRGRCTWARALRWTQPRGCGSPARPRCRTRRPRSAPAQRLSAAQFPPRKRRSARWKTAAERRQGSTRAPGGTAAQGCICHAVGWSHIRAVCSDMQRSEDAAASTLEMRKSRQEGCGLQAAGSRVCLHVGEYEVHAVGVRRHRRLGAEVLRPDAASVIRLQPQRPKALAVLPAVEAAAHPHRLRRQGEPLQQLSRTQLIRLARDRCPLPGGLS